MYVNNLKTVTDDVINNNELQKYAYLLFAFGNNHQFSTQGGTFSLHSISISLII